VILFVIITAEGRDWIYSTEGRDWLLWKGVLESGRVVILKKAIDWTFEWKGGR
jgi:hypothetical protein